MHHWPVSKSGQQKFGWVTEEGHHAHKTCTTYPKGFIQKQVKKEDQGERLNRFFWQMAVKRAGDKNAYFQRQIKRIPIRLASRRSSGVQLH